MSRLKTYLALKFLFNTNLLYKQVEQVLTFEELLPTKLRRKFVTGFKEVFPNQKPTIMKHLQNLFWDGEPYDTKRAINSALRPPLVSF